MSHQAVPAKSGEYPGLTDAERFPGFTDAERKFLQELEKFLMNYHGFAGTTPYDEAIATTLDLSVTVKGTRAPVTVKGTTALTVPCKKWCVDQYGRLYCCLY
jgi:hypothetical protein